MLNHIVLWYISREFWFIQVGDFFFWQYARVIQANSVNITPVQLQVGIDRFSCEWAGQLAASRSAAPFSCFSTVPELRPFASCSKARGCTDSSRPFLSQVVWPFLMVKRVHWTDTALLQLEEGLWFGFPEICAAPLWITWWIDWLVDWHFWLERSIWAKWAVDSWTPSDANTLPCPAITVLSSRIAVQKLVTHERPSTWLCLLPSLHVLTVE